MAMLQTQEDNAVCVANAAQMDAWSKDEDDAYQGFFVVTGVVIAVVFAAALYFACRKGKSHSDRAAPDDDTRLRPKLRKILSAVIVGVRTLDFMTDWGQHAGQHTTRPSV